MEKYAHLGLMLTPQRIAILDYLEGNLEHPSAESIYKKVGEKFPTMSLATVYNTLETLRQKGIVQELNIDPAKKRFDPNPRPHHHVLCLKCKKIVDLHEDYQLPAPEIAGESFEIMGNNIEFYGICGDCRDDL